HVFVAVRADMVDRGDEALAVQRAFVVAQQAREARALDGVGEADELGEASHVFAGDDQARLRAVAVDRGRNTEAQQHALHTFEHRGVRAADADRDALGLRTLHAAFGVEQAAQEAAVKLARATFDVRRDGLAAGPQAEVHRQLADGRCPETEFAAATHFVPAGEITAEAARGIGRRGHDGVRSAHAHVAVAYRGTRPHRQLRTRLGDVAVADQKAHHVTLVHTQLLRVRGAPHRAFAMVLQQHFVAGLEVAGRAPLGGEAPARERRDTAHTMVGSEAQRETI